MTKQIPKQVKQVIKTNVVEPISSAQEAQRRFKPQTIKDKILNRLNPMHAKNVFDAQKIANDKAGFTDTWTGLQKDKSLPAHKAQKLQTIKDIIGAKTEAKRQQALYNKFNSTDADRAERAMTNYLGQKDFIDQTAKFNPGAMEAHRNAKNFAKQVNTPSGRDQLNKQAKILNEANPIVKNRFKDLFKDPKENLSGLVQAVKERTGAGRRRKGGWFLSDWLNKKMQNIPVDTKYALANQRKNTQPSTFWKGMHTVAMNQHDATPGGSRKKGGSFWDKLSTVAEHQHDPIGGKRKKGGIRKRKGGNTAAYKKQWLKNYRPNSLDNFD